MTSSSPPKSRSSKVPTLSVYFFLRSATSIPTGGEGEVPRHLPTNKRLQQTQAQVDELILCEQTLKSKCWETETQILDEEHKANDYHRNYRFHHLSCDHRFRYQMIVTLCIRFLVRAVSHRRIFRVVSL
ncbi:hypothetical protein EG68_04740 [Paragonimus skrjabini miyazakii]|uniref:Uncharacterized protein n=1 Tax=Paragonimus skrjabini miyazakii TaxID=59628 RepID=A0A8S9YWX4_9TREM|nr:hypothetical protein EG68_04740 [Paragonimus skrjabini miyazakii]